jgi:hypothetical protein
MNKTRINTGIQSIAMLFFFQVSLAQNATASSKIDDSDLKTFWEYFKKQAIKENYAEIVKMTYFPFAGQGGNLSKTEFVKDFVFQPYDIEELKNGKLKLPKKSQVQDWALKKQKNLVSEPVYETLGSGSFYFCKINNHWKFIGLFYGE